MLKISILIFLIVNKLTRCSTITKCLQACCMSVSENSDNEECEVYSKAPSAMENSENPRVRNEYESLEDDKE